MTLPQFLATWTALSLIGAVFWWRLMRGDRGPTHHHCNRDSERLRGGRVDQHHTKVDNL